MDQQRKEQASLKDAELAIIPAAQEEQQGDQHEDRDQHQPEALAQVREAARLMNRINLARVGKEQMINAVAAVAIGAQVKTKAVQRQRRIGFIVSRVDLR